MISEIKKEIYKYIDQFWTDTPVQYGYRKTDIAADNWLQVGLIYSKKKLTKHSFDFIEGILQVSVFSTETNEYEVDHMCDKVRVLLENRWLCSEHFEITIEECGDRIRYTDTRTSKILQSHVLSFTFIAEKGDG